MGVALHELDETWNFIHPFTLGADWKRMQKHIYHFAGEPNRAQTMPEVRWK